jgi:hypothetical protein
MKRIPKQEYTADGNRIDRVLVTPRQPTFDEPPAQQAS